MRLGGGMFDTFMLCLINVVALHWARLLFGWVTVCRQVNHLGT